MLEFKKKRNKKNMLPNSCYLNIVRKKAATRQSFSYRLIETLMNYMTNISFYFALKASNASDVREHPVIQALFNLRQTLEKVENLEQKLNSEIDEFIETLTNESTTTKKIDIKKTKKEKKQPVLEEAYSEDGIEEEFEHFDEEGLEESDREEEYNVEDIEEEFKSLKKAAKKRKRQDVEDFGELDALDELDMEDKLIKKKSIRDYVAKIESVSIYKEILLGTYLPLFYRNKLKTQTNIKVILTYHIEIVSNKNAKVWHNLKISQPIWMMPIGMKMMLPQLMRFVMERQIQMMNIMQKSLLRRQQINGPN
jgi:U3 small nucleolar RNA-associated protein 3